MPDNESYLNDLYSVSGDTPYADVLTQVQQATAVELKEVFNKQSAFSDEDKYRIRKFIEQHIVSKQLTCRDFADIHALTAQIYKDMVLYSFLTDFLEPKAIDEMGIEEINVNSWDCIYLLTSKNGKQKLPHKFLSPQHAKDIIKRILTICNATIDEAHPLALGYLEKNIRSAVISTPIVDDEIGVACSIRVVNFSNLSRERLISYGTATADMLDFTAYCIRYGVSICISGATGSGKTGTAGFILSNVPDDVRMLTLEEGSREFNLVKKDENGETINDVVHLLTRPNNNKDLHIDQERLLEMLMRFHPAVIGIGEMRSHEAFAAVEASRTGHTVITTTHATSAVDTYERIVLLAKKVSNYNEESLYRMAIKAFPIIVYQEQLPDKSRKLKEIIEGIAFENGEVKYRTIYQYQINETSYDSNFISGEFVKRHPPSAYLMDYFRQKGAPPTVLSALGKGGER